ncbi:MAG: TetR/AcrR family transcriptional regulator [Pseudomonadota bacterium]
MPKKRESEAAIAPAGAASRSDTPARAPVIRKPLKAAAEMDSWRGARNRNEKAELIRDCLFRAAGQVVGEVGYADASIALITSKAGLAQGTFYNYFESRQDILDQLLPALGQQMRQHVRDQARKGRDFSEREELAFRAFFSFLKETPHFFRILNEAESLAPNAHHTHIEAVARGYMDFLNHAHTDGEFPGFEPKELEVVVFMLMAARSYLPMRYANGAEGQTEIPDWVVKAYMKFIKYGLMGQPSAKTAGASRARVTKGAAGPVPAARKTSAPKRTR